MTDALTDDEFARLEPEEALIELGLISADSAEITRLRALSAVTRGVSVDEKREGRALPFDGARLVQAQARFGLRRQSYVRVEKMRAVGAKELAGGAMEATGVNGRIILESGSLTISRKGTGLLNFLSQGLQGDKVVPLRSITAVQLMEPGALNRGYLRLSINGRDPVGGIIEAGIDENAVMFDSRQLGAFKALRDAIRAAIVSPQSVAGQVAGPSAADEIEKLSSLLQRGLLTEEEFTTKKRELLGL